MVRFKNEIITDREKWILSGTIMDRALKPRRQANLDKYYSVEIFINGNFYQFKLWNNISMPMCILIKEDSDILSSLRVGETLNMKYYAEGSYYPVEDLKTEVRNITRNDQGRFKGHCFVALDIAENQNQ